MMEVNKIKLERIDLDKDFIYPSLSEMLTKKFYSDFYSKKDEVIKAALKKNGFDLSDTEFIKNNFQLIIQDGDKFEHLFYHHSQPDEKRIISFEKIPDINIGDMNIDLNDKGYGIKHTITTRYY